MAIFQKLGVEINNPVDAGGNQRGSNMLDEMVWKTTVESLMNGAFTALGGKVYATKAAMDADLSPAANTPALVIGDPVAANNGLYMKVGGTGSGSWTRIGDVPGYGVVPFVNSGAGTPNAITATATLPVNSTAGSQIYTLNVTANNTGNVTVNGISLRTNSGNEISPDGITAGMILAFIFNGTNYRLLSDQASAAILAAAEAAADEAESWALMAESAYTALATGVVAFGPFSGDGVETNFTLPLAPILSGNCAVFINGVFQDYSARSVAGTTLTFTEPPPYGTTISGVIFAPVDDIVSPPAGSVAAVAMDFGDAVALRSGLSVYSISQVDTAIKGVKGANIASAASIDLGAATGEFVDITGNVTITSLGTAAAGVVRTVRFTGTPIITHNATSLILYSRTNVTAFNGLVMVFRSLGSGNWIEESQTPAIGTWTPGIAFGGAAVGVTYGGLNAGRWIKNGRKVSVWGCLNLSAKGSSTGAATVTGLPFTIISTAPLGVVGPIGNFANLAGLTGAPMLLGSANATTMNFGQTAAASSAGLTDTAFTNTSRVSFSVEYETAS